MARAPNSAARPVDAARKLWPPLRTQLPTKAIAHGNTTVSSPTAAPIAAEHDRRSPQPRRLPRRQRRDEQHDPGEHEQRHRREPELAPARRRTAGRSPKAWNVGWIALLPISRPIGQATAATRAPSTATLKRDVEQGGDHRAPEPARAVAQEAVLRGLRVRDRRVEPVDDVGRGVARSVVDPGQRPRRRRVVAARHGGEPARPRHHAGPFELVERAEGEGGGADASAGAAHPEVGRWR